MVNKAHARCQDGILSHLAARSKVCVCGRSHAGFAGSKPAGWMDSLLSAVCCQEEVTYHSSRGVLPSMVFLCVIVKPRQCGGPGPVAVVAPRGEWRERIQCHSEYKELELPCPIIARYIAPSGRKCQVRFESFRKVSGFTHTYS
jgi:hypothetical protein